MKVLRRKVVFLAVAGVMITSMLTGCKKDRKPVEAGVDQVTGIVTQMTQIMVTDVTNPPLAARFFAYAMLAGYEIALQNDSSIIDITKKLHDFPAIERPSVGNYSWQLAAVYAMLETASAMQPSGKLLNARMTAITDSCTRSGMSAELIESSHSYGKAIAKEILAYAKSDGYRNISNYARYAPKEEEGHWFPTPPGFFGAIEPYFQVIRPFFLDSASEFLSEPPAPYSKRQGSPFFNLAKQVYDANKSLSGEQKDIAAFWDCNPFALQEEGHLQIGVKKISPGAHWMGIAGIACRKKGLTFAKTIEVHTVLAMTLMDAFICCWDEKYRSDRIRPESAIRQFIDPDWKPFLQTPPFPEYLSGHSVISAASAEVLTHYIGDGFSFEDVTEIPYGLGTRHYASFHEAAAEAAVSRFYGGIHFMDAISNGLIQGKKVGLHNLQQIAL